MGEAAKAFWIEEEESFDQAPAVDYEDIATICTGINDDCWKFGSD